MVRRVGREGFTLVELSISLLFIGILSITVALIINNTMEAYRRGLTLAQLNSTATNLVDDMRMTIQSSTAKSLKDSCATSIGGRVRLLRQQKEECLVDNAYNFVTISKREQVRITNGDGEEIIDDVPIYGTFCTGTYSYIWNSGYFEMEDAEFDSKTNRMWAKLIYKDKDDSEVRTYATSEELPFRFLKVEDELRSVCMAAISNTGEQYEIGVSGINNEIDIRDFSLLQEEPMQLLANDNSGSLSLYDLSVARPVESGEMRNIFYSISFILGTTTGGINVMARGNSCSPPKGYESENFNYCAINKFSFAVQVNGG